MLFRFCTQVLKQKDISEIVQKMGAIFSAQDFSPEYSRQIKPLVNQISPYISQLKSDDLQKTCQIMNAFQFFNDDAFHSFYQRSFSLYQDDLITTIDQLKLLEELINADDIHPNQAQLQSIFEFLKQIINQTEQSDEFSYALFNYGFMLNRFQGEDQAYQKDLTIRVQEFINDLNSEQLGMTTMGVALSQLNNKEIFNKLEDRMHQIGKDLYMKDLTRICNGFCLSQKGSNYFWKNAENSFMIRMDQVPASDLGCFASIMIQHGSVEFWNKVDQTFLKRKNEFKWYLSVPIYSTFGQLSSGSFELWEQFNLENETIFENINSNEGGYLILSLIKILPKLQTESIERIIKFILKKGSNMQRQLQQDLGEQMVKSGLASEEVKDVLRID